MRAKVQYILDYTKIAPEQSSLLERPNFAQYPTEQELSNSKDTTSSQNNNELEGENVQPTIGEQIQAAEAQGVEEKAKVEAEALKAQQEAEEARRAKAEEAPIVEAPVAQSYGDKGVELLDKLTANSTGFIPGEGKEVGLELENLTPVEAHANQYDNQGNPIDKNRVKQVSDAVNFSANDAEGKGKKILPSQKARTNLVLMLPRAVSFRVHIIALQPP